MVVTVSAVITESKTHMALQRTDGSRDDKIPECLVWR